MYLNPEELGLVTNEISIPSAFSTELKVFYTRQKAEKGLSSNTIKLRHLLDGIFSLEEWEEMR